MKWVQVAQHARGWTVVDICPYCVKNSLPPEVVALFSFLAWLLTKSGDIELNFGPTTHSNIHKPAHTPVT